MTNEREVTFNPHCSVQITRLYVDDQEFAVDQTVPIVPINGAG